MDPQATSTRLRPLSVLPWLCALLLALSTNAQAQDARVVQAEYEHLHEAAEMAKEAYVTKPTAGGLEIMNRAVDTFRRYEQTHRDALRTQALDLGDGHAQRPMATGGPDGFGYRFIDSTEPGGPIVSFIDISTTGTLVASGDDLSSINSGIFAPVTLGAPFSFYGTSFTSLVPATNGYIALGDNADGGPDLSNDCPLPATPSTPFGTPGARMYPLHDDLVSSVYHEFFPACPDPNVSGSCDVFHYASTHFFGSGPFEFEVILDNTTTNFLYQYRAGGNNGEAGSGSTTGIQDFSPPTTGLTYACNTFLSLPGPGGPGLAILFFANQPPDCSAAAANPDRLWPPNHKMRNVNVAGVTDPDGDPITITVTGITQDEPVDATGNGDGNTAPDGRGVGTSTAGIRAERAGGGNGRVYEISFEAADDKGATCTGAVQVCVPHDQGGGTCVDDGQTFDSTSDGGAAARVTPAPEPLVLDAYPNPFNPTTTITFTIPQEGDVRVAVYDVTGRLVRVLAQGSMPAGRHQVRFEAGGLSSGLYLVRFDAPQRSLTRHLLLTK